MRDIMSDCLDEARVRTTADGEADATTGEHLAFCAECRRRVDEAREALAEIERLTATVPVPPTLASRVTRAVTQPHAPEGGATTLRELPRHAWRRRAWGSAIAVAAGILIIVLMMPAIDAPRQLSAAEILGRSLQTLTPAGGIERREFDLALQLPAVASIENGTYRIDELIDHDAPGRYRVSKYAPDGALLSAMSEDMVARRREVLFRVGGELFGFTFTLDPAQRRGVRDLERQHVEGVIRLLQAMAGQTVAEIDAAAGKRYVVELPSLSGGQATTGLWDLREARVVVDGESFSIVEAVASGSYLGEPFSVSFHLRRRDVRPSGAVSPREFELPHDPTVIAIAGAGTEDVARDVLTATLSELARTRHARSTP
jgi:hypothetical protein